MDKIQAETILAEYLEDKPIIETDLKEAILVAVRCMHEIAAIATIVKNE